MNLIRKWTDDYHPTPIVLWVLALVAMVVLIGGVTGVIPREDTVKMKLDRIEAKLDQVLTSQKETK